MYTSRTHTYTVTMFIYFPVVMTVVVVAGGYIPRFPDGRNGDEEHQSGIAEV
jgi:hypothetical protein